MSNETKTTTQMIDEMRKWNDATDDLREYLNVLNVEIGTDAISYQQGAGDFGWRDMTDEMIFDFYQRYIN